MTSTIAAITTGGGGVVTTADASGNLSLLSGATTILAATPTGVAVTGTLSVSGAVTLTTALPVASGGTGTNASTGTGSVVLATSPTLVTPLLGTPTSGNLTNCTLPAGTVIQTVVVNYNTSSSTSSATPSATGLTATITPRFNNSKVLVSAVGNFYQQSATGQGNAYIYKATTQLAWIGQFYSANAGYITVMAGSYLDSPATTSAVTYNVYFSAVAGAVNFNVNNPYSTLILMEIQQ